MSLLNIGVSGLATSQTSLQITGNNIANASVEGYSRQRAELATKPEFYTGSGFLGTGAKVEDISRVVEGFLITQLRSDTASFNNLDSFLTSIGEMDTLLADNTSGLSPTLASLFSDIEAGAQDPTSMPARQLILSDLEGLIERFHTIHDRLQSQQSTINQQLSAFTGQASSLAESIAGLNEAIVEELSRGTGTPNQLLDERDELLRQLSELITVRTSTEDNGAVSVFVGSGQSLVLGANYNQLSTTPSTSHPGETEIEISGFGGTQPITDLISGGKMGGLVDYREDVLRDIYNSLGRIALGISDTMNQQNHLGLDIEGNFGGDIFTDINTTTKTLNRVIGDAANTGNAILNVTITDVDQLTTSNYIVDFSGAGSTYQIIRESDNTVVSAGVMPPTLVSVDGFDLDVVSGATAASDKYYLYPTKEGAQAIDLSLTRPQQFAFASPIITGSDIGNTGTGIISTGVVNTTTGALAISDLQTPVSMRFLTATTFEVIDPVTKNPVPGWPAVNAFTPNTINTYSSPNGAYDIELNGAPLAGDNFTVRFNLGGVSDNRNAVALGALRTASTLDNGSLNFEDAYGRLLEEIGAETARARISSDAGKTLLEQSQMNRDSISGVNLDEEAANLIKFEQAYNASAQIITVARQIFDTLLAAFR